MKLKRHHAPSLQSNPNANEWAPLFGCCYSSMDDCQTSQLSLEQEVTGSTTRTAEQPNKNGANKIKQNTTINQT
jgi:hypothetical protein